MYVNPTYEDNFPTTNIEALACGTPVITYNTGGSIEAIDERTGIVVEQGHLEGLAKSIERICKSENKASTRTACRERAVNLYNKDNKFNEYLELYKSLIK